jgi:sterol desaturase/sphingolipid hydroxylase (fatty acid hydroxylase superfamily)
MEDIVIVRSTIFVAVLVIFLLFQLIFPSRKNIDGRWKYMLSNVGIVLFNNVVIGLLPLIPYQMSIIAKNNTWGLINFIFNDSNLLVNNSLLNISMIVFGIVVLDIFIYFQHRLFHKVDFLWRLHSMHHIDPMLDVTSGLRFHPIEIVISNFVKVGVIFLIGINPLSVIIFEIALNGLAMFNHSNIKINYKIEKVLNKILITPALHTIHHSKIFEETNSNFGFSVPWWDKLFHTFKANGKYQQSEIKIGTYPMPDKKYQLFPGMLIQPFLRESNK